MAVTKRRKRSRNGGKKKYIRVTTMRRNHCALCGAVKSTRWRKSKKLVGRVCTKCAREEHRSVSVSDGAVIVGPSKLGRNAGRGLFAAGDFARNELITFYAGTATSMVPRVTSLHSIRAVKGNGLDEDATYRKNDPWTFSSFVGHFSNGWRVKKLCNAIICAKRVGADCANRDGRRWRAALKCLKPIRKGDEIMTYYGRKTRT